MSDQQASSIAEARAIIAGRAVAPERALELAVALKKAGEPGLAWQVLAKVPREAVQDRALRLRLAQEQTLCTYKDTDLPVVRALRMALATLSQADDLALTQDQESLGLAGAIYKRLWQTTGQRGDLERSLIYYRRGYELDPTAKEGYTSINAAFLLDLLAETEAGEAAVAGATAALAERRRADAQEIRRVLVERLPDLETKRPELAGDWWFLVTMAEAQFGLGDYDEADRWLTRAKELEPDDWALQSTGAQLAALWQLHAKRAPGAEADRAAQVLDQFLGSKAARESALVGKVGLALSGGGFRASLFHIGVLARLAELDLLRRVEVISCVSGGSIIGAHYYLELRERLETEDLEALDEAALRQVYIDVVRKVAAEFLDGVQTNIRMRVFANPLPLLRSVLDRSYSRTVRLGELFEEQLFSRVWRDQAEARRPKGPLVLSELKIQPLNERAGFKPKAHNWRRRAKVPILVLNATTLNTGHNWQYTASFMGEPPWAIDPRVDGTSRLRRMYYHEAPEQHRGTPLSQAVVASACVPGLFEAIRMDGLYERRPPGEPVQPFVVRQVDGGVHDNQGIASLLEQDCTVVLVSDASGQTTTALDPGGGTLAPLLRSNAVLMQRVRQEQYGRLDAMQRGGLLKGLMFIHLKQDLEVEAIDWKGCEVGSALATRNSDPLTSYGVRKDLQELLAGLRTDLDSFSDLEAYALMTSGYRMAERFLPEVTTLHRPHQAQEPWDFLHVAGAMAALDPSDRDYLRLRNQLRIGGELFFRVWRQSRALLLTAALAVLGLFVLLFGSLLTDLRLDSTVWRWELRIWHLVLLLMVGIMLVVPKLRAAASRIGIGLLGLVLWAPAWLHLKLIDPLFLRYGRLDRLRSTKAPAGRMAAPGSAPG